MSDPRPMPEICPFLATARDPDSVHNYPSAENACHKTGDALSVTEDYQAEYCLRARHWFCPVYTGAVKHPVTPIRIPDEPLPITQSIATPTVAPAPVEASRNTTRTRLTVTLTVIVAGLLVSAGLLAASQQPTGIIAIPTTQLATLPIVQTPTDAPIPTETLIPTPTELPSETPTVTRTLTATLTESPTITLTSSLTVTLSLTPTPKACQVPSGWGKYTVAVGETYFKIASRYGTTVEALQRVNCLADPGRLLTGQVINVPPLPTATLTVTPVER